MPQNLQLGDPIKIGCPNVQLSPKKGHNSLNLVALASLRYGTEPLREIQYLLYCAVSITAVFNFRKFLL